MTRKELKQYRSLKIEIENLEKEIDKLRDRLLDVPEVMGKVQKSGDNFPYIEGHVSVKMNEPREEAEIRKRIGIKRTRKFEAECQAVKIEQFIAKIPDSTDRLIFDMAFLQGKRQQDIAEQIGYSRSRIAQIISKNLKD